MKKNFHLVGVLHLPPLPGAANYQRFDFDEISKIFAINAKTLEDAGFTHIMIQDGNDNPQPIKANIATIAALTRIGTKVRESISIPLGVIIGHNDGAASVAIAHVIQAQFVRIKVLTGVSIGPTGIINGCALEVARMKKELGSETEVWADVHEATSRVIVGGIEWAANEAIKFGGAEKLIITRDSGVTDALMDIAKLSGEMGNQHPMLVGGRVSLSTLQEVISSADGAIIGSALQNSDRSNFLIEVAKAQAFGAILKS